ncbi:MAG: ATP-binding protein [bacterium]
MSASAQSKDPAEKTSFLSGTSVLGSLKVRMFLAFTLLFALIIFTLQSVERYGIPFTPFEGKYQEKETEAFLALNLTADLKKERLSRIIEEFSDDIILFSNNNLISDELGELDRALHTRHRAGTSLISILKELRDDEIYRSISRYLERIRSIYPSYNRVDLMDASDNIILISTDNNAIGMPFSNLPEETVQNISPGQPSIAMWQDPLEGFSKLLIAYPLIDVREGQFQNNTLMIIHINIGNVIQPILHTGGGLGMTGEALLINKEVRILAPLKHPLPDGTLAKPLEYQIKAEPAVRAARGEEGIVRTEDYRGITVLAAYRYIPLTADFGWGMVVKRDEAEIFKSFKQSEFQSLLIAVIFIFFTIIVSIMLADSLSKPLHSLSRTAQLVELGNLDVRADPVGTSETKLLADALNSMLDRFQTWTTDLDKQVKQRTAQLNEKNEELEQIVYVTSHDLRSPLVNIQGFSRELETIIIHLEEILKDEDLSAGTKDEIARLLNEDVPEALGFILGSTDKMDALLKGLLRLSRLGRASLMIESIDMNFLIKEIVNSFEHQIKEKNVTLKVDDLFPATGDITQINQVFSNLLDNAIKYLDPNKPGKISITGEKRGNEVIYCVEDNGIGFAPEFRRKIFEIFHRLDPSHGSGDGLGLTIVRKILDRHGGRIWTESTSGKGTRFYVALPEV